MSDDRGLVSFFEDATGIDIPEEICGIAVPDPELGDLGEVASQAFDVLSNAGEMVDKAVATRELAARGAKSAANCWGVIDRASDIFEAIATRIEPLAPLFHPVDRAPEALQLFSKDSLDACVEIVLNVLDLGKLMEKIMNLLEGVRRVFSGIAETCGDVFEFISGVFGDLVEAVSSALHLDGVLDGLSDFFDGVKQLIADLMDIGGILRPILEAWKSANFLEGLTFAANNFEQVVGALTRFMPSWDTCRNHYETAREFGFKGNGASKKAWQMCRELIRSVCEIAGVKVSSGFGSRAIDIQPTVAPRGGIPILEDEAEEKKEQEKEEKEREDREEQEVRDEQDEGREDSQQEKEDSGAEVTQGPDLTNLGRLNKYPDGLAGDIEKLARFAMHWVESQTQRDGNEADRLVNEMMRLHEQMAEEHVLGEAICHQLHDMAMSIGALTLCEFFGMSGYKEHRVDFEHARHPLPQFVTDALWLCTQHLLWAGARLVSAQAHEEHEAVQQYKSEFTRCLRCIKEGPDPLEFQGHHRFGWGCPGSTVVVQPPNPADAAFMQTVASSGTTWGQYVRTHSSFINQQSGSLAGPWAECIVWAAIFESSNDWSSMPQFAEAGVVGGVLTTLEGSLKSNIDRDTVMDAADRLEQAAHTFVQEGQVLPTIVQIATLPHGFQSGQIAKIENPQTPGTYLNVRVPPDAQPGQHVVVPMPLQPSANLSMNITDEVSLEVGGVVNVGAMVAKVHNSGSSHSAGVVGECSGQIMEDVVSSLDSLF